MLTPKEERIQRLTRKRWKELRFIIWVRDNYRCVRCGKLLSLRSAHIDHILPIAKGGGNARKNLRTLCKACHSTRADETHDKLWESAVRKHIVSPLTPRWE